MQIAVASVALAVLLFAAPAQASYFHLSEGGMCNKTPNTVPGVAAGFECSSDCFTCKISDNQKINDPQNPDGYLWAGDCATATFQVEPELHECTMDLTIYAGDEAQCEIKLNVTASGAKTIDIVGCRQVKEFELVPHSGSEHFQIDIKPTQ